MAFGGVLLDEVRQDLRIGGGLEEAAAVLEVFAQLGAVHDVAVVGKGEVAAVVAEEEGLYVVESAAARSGIPHVAYGAVTLERGQFGVVEHFGHEAEALYPLQPPVIVRGHYSAAFLTPVLQGMEAVVCQFSGIGNAPDGENAAFFVYVAVLDHFVSERLFSFS